MKYHGQINTRKNIKKFLKETIEKLQNQICNNPQVVNKTLKNDHIHIKDNITGEVTIKKITH